MLKIIAQFNSHRGPTALGEHKLTFDIQKEMASGLWEILQQFEKYPQVVLHIELLGNDASDIVQELQEPLKTRQNKKIHALFDEIADMQKIESSEVKKEFKKILIKEGTIKKSLAELNEKQQGDLLGILEDRLIELKFHD